MTQVKDVCLARKRLGLSQEKLAEALGVSRNTVSRWERGECSPSADKLATLERLLAQLEVSATLKEKTAPEEASASKEDSVPPPVVPTKAKRWPVALICAGVVCALMIGIAALLGVYSISQRLGPDNIVPAEEIEREEVDGVPSVSITLRPLQP